MTGISVADVRRQLKHPIVDSDGHWVESLAVLAEYVRDIGGGAMVDRYIKTRAVNMSWYQATDAERIRQRYRRTVWWHYPYEAKEYATIHLPRMFYERLDEIGIDFAIVYPSAALNLEAMADAELRAVVARAYNMMAADLFRPYADRITPVAVVLRGSPKAAIEEATFAVRELGYKAIMIGGAGIRYSATNEKYIDGLGLDNEESYDPFWQACMDLRVAVTSHAGSQTWSDRASATNYVFNHVGHFAQANSVFAKAVFLGGVGHRFPKLNFGFLEGGVAWARSLCSDLIGHYEKRTYEAASKYLKPTLLDLDEFRRLIDRYGDGRLKSLREEIVAGIDGWERGSLQDQVEREREHLHDFRAAGVNTRKDVEALFSRNFYFGCEADDPMTMLAFDRRLGTPLKALFSSDISHWDVPNMLEVVPEAYEMLEHGMVDEQDFRAFMFSNIVNLHGGMNPDFFKGTVVEAAAAAELAKAKPPQ